MAHQITQPSKEQVRAYMAAREVERRPPPPPEEIRRQLGWRLQPADEDRLLFQIYLIPTIYLQLASQLAIDWLLAPVCQPASACDTR